MCHEDELLIQEQYPTKGTQIPDLLVKGYTRARIKFTARYLGIQYIGVPKTGQDDRWKNGMYKTCSGCAKIFLPRHEESKSKWAVRKYCDWVCMQKFSKLVRFTEEENNKICIEYPIIGTKTNIPNKTARQIRNQAAKLGIKYIRKKNA